MSNANGAAARQQNSLTANFANDANGHGATSGGVSTVGRRCVVFNKKVQSRHHAIHSHRVRSIFALFVEIRGEPLLGRLSLSADHGATTATDHRELRELRE